MTGKTVAITGPTAGIGQATALELALRGASLVLVARNPAKAAATVEAITAEVPGAEITVVPGDLSMLASVREAATGVLGACERLDVLVDNAGMAALVARSTPDGFDEMLATNYLGPFLLTHLLIARLRESTPARVVVVGSEAHRVTGGLHVEHFEEMGTYSGWRSQLAYGRTKLLDLLFADELARRLRGSGVTVNSCCPGLVGTDLAREVGLSPRMTELAGRTPVVRTPAQGARMSVRLASSPSVEGITGRFFTSTSIATVLPMARHRRDPAVAARVYERTCELVGVEPLASSAAV